MRVLAQTGSDDIARVCIMETTAGRKIECVESIQPPLSREDKWVLIVSTLHGCPVGCSFCDAGTEYHGKLTAEEILHQIDYLVRKRYPDGTVPSKKFKIQFARMGEPAFNPAVIDVLEALPRHYRAPGLIPSLSTVAPHGTDRFFEDLLEVKERLYRGRFQFQFSLHTTDEQVRRTIVPIRTWDFARMARYGEMFHEEGDRKIVLNFALAEGAPINPDILLRHFPPEIFLIKMTPINPTYAATRNNLSSYIRPDKTEYEPVQDLKAAGFEVIVSIGELEENAIGSNCGQYVLTHQRSQQPLKTGYTYDAPQGAFPPPG